MKKMKKLFLASLFVAAVSFNVQAQTKKDGTPDMRFKANKEIFGNTYSTPYYTAPSYAQPKQERTYKDGGEIRWQKGYFKSNGTYVAPHLKTKPDNKTWNNLDAWDPN